jgi:hypothetical protein
MRIVSWNCRGFVSKSRRVILLVSCIGYNEDGPQLDLNPPDLIAALTDANMYNT